MHTFRQERNWLVNSILFWNSTGFFTAWLSAVFYNVYDMPLSFIIGLLLTIISVVSFVAGILTTRMLVKKLY